MEMQSKNKSKNKQPKLIATTKSKGLKKIITMTEK
jgi:hypothetical protein